MPVGRLGASVRAPIGESENLRFNMPTDVSVLNPTATGAFVCPLLCSKPHTFVDLLLGSADFTILGPPSVP